VKRSLLVIIIITRVKVRESEKDESHPWDSHTNQLIPTDASSSSAALHYYILSTNKYLFTQKEPRSPLCVYSPSEILSFETTHTQIHTNFSSPDFL